MIQFCVVHKIIVSKRFEQLERSIDTFSHNPNEKLKSFDPRNPHRSLKVARRLVRRRFVVVKQVI